MSEVKLRNCPCCGGKANLRIYEDFTIDFHSVYKYYVQCNECEMQSSMTANMDKAINAWNTRKPMDDIVERLKHVKEKEQPEINGKTTIRDLEVFKMTLGYAIKIVKGGVED